VAVQELRFGDNDTLSAQVATLVEADYLFLLTDVDALYTANPKVTVVSSSRMLVPVVCSLQLVAF
jgi:glutamate 5-kinase